GGDPDNFEYPRYDLDICLFRVYENGQPAKIEHFLKFNSNGPNDGELIFVSGHPGKTDRQLTLDELVDTRDRYLPYVLRMFNRRAKPNGERLPHFRDSARESLELELFSTEPIYDDYEILRLTDSLTDFASQFGANDPMVQKVLRGKSPHARAAELVTGTKLKDVDVRKDLYGKDAAALEAAHDPILDLARLIDTPARAARKIYDA